MGQVRRGLCACLITSVGDCGCRDRVYTAFHALRVNESVLMVTISNGLQCVFRVLASVVAVQEP